MLRHNEKKGMVHHEGTPSKTGEEKKAHSELGVEKKNNLINIAIPNNNHFVDNQNEKIPKYISGNILMIQRKIRNILGIGSL